MAQWSGDPTENLIIDSGSSGFSYVQVESSFDGTYYVCWTNNWNKSEIRITLLDHNGYWKWPQTSIKVNTQPLGMSTYPNSMKVDNEGNAIIGYSRGDIGSLNDVILQKISPNGEFLWGDQGILISRPNKDEFGVEIIVNNANEIFACFTSQQYGNSEFRKHIGIQKLSKYGDYLWEESGIDIEIDSLVLEVPKLFPLPDGGCLLTYFSIAPKDHYYDRELHVIRLDNQGRHQWNDPVTIKDSDGFGSYVTYDAYLSNEGILYVIWNDFRNIVNTYSKLFIQGINLDGSKLWRENGEPVSHDFNSQHWDPNIAGEIENEGILCLIWTESDALQSQYTIKGQKLSFSGVLLWGENGLEIDSDKPRGILQCTIYESNLFVLHKKECNDYRHNQLVVNQIDLLGQLKSNSSIIINSICDSKSSYKISEFNRNRAAITWVQNDYVKSQNINTDGTIGISDTGLEKIEMNKEVELSIKNGELKIRVNDEIKENTIRIYNPKGSLVLIEKFNESFSKTINYKGLFVVVVSDKKGRLFSKKIVII